MYDKEIGIGALIAAGIKGELNSSDQKILEEWLSENLSNKILYNELMKEESVQEKMIRFNAPDRNAVWFKVVKEIRGISENRVIQKKNWLWQRISLVAASAFIVIGLTLFFYNHLYQKTNNVEYTQDIPPGKMGATLTLSNGKKIILNNVVNGELAKEVGIRISKKSDGQIIYQNDNNENPNPDDINTLSTGKGETYMLILPDQSKVWINASSSLTYTATLRKKGVRRVKLEGEAYFEISKDVQHPFVVESNGQEVEVLGTHFNISSYKEDITTKTTLLEGSVNITPLYTNGTEMRSEILKPNQQAVLSSGEIKIRNVIADSFIDWKNGVFNFEDENLQSIMRKVARWYDVDIIYNGTENDTRIFSGAISRSVNVSKVLETFGNSSKLKFKIEGRKIIVIK